MNTKFKNACFFSFKVRIPTRDKRQETRDKRQETRDKRQETRDKRQFVSFLKYIYNISRDFRNINFLKGEV